MNYCDYDAIVHYPPGAFSSQHKTVIVESVIEIEKDKTLSKEQVESFQNCEYKTFQIVKPIVLYRLYGRYQKEPEDGLGHVFGARLGGRYVSTEFAESVIDAKLRLALHPEWANTKMYEAKLLVPPGTRISFGIVASVKLPTGTELPGGAEQILLPPDWPREWIQGYRRVTGRQLQKPPFFWPEEPQEISKGINSLYPKVCPLCCCTNVKMLADDERFDIVGCKGGYYTMRMKCLNPQCEYYW